MGTTLFKMTFTMFQSYRYRSLPLNSHFRKITMYLIGYLKANANNFVDVLKNKDFETS